MLLIKKLTAKMPRTLRDLKKTLRFGGEKRSRYVLLFVILPVCLLLRFYGLRWGTDNQGRFYPFHPDEKILIEVAAGLRDSYDPHFSAYGTLPMYLLWLIGKPVSLIARFSLFDLESPDGIRFTYYVGRFISAFFASLAVLLTFLLGKRFYGYRVGLLSSCYLAFTVLHIQLAHFYTVDMLFTFLTILSVLLAFNIMKYQSLKNYLTCGIAIGLASATRLNGVILVIPFITAHFLAQWKEPSVEGSSRFRGRVTLIFKTLISKKLAATIMAVLVTFILLEPYSILNFREFFASDTYRDFLWNVKMVRGEVSQIWTLEHLKTSPYLYSLTNLFFYSMGPLLEIVSLLGIAYLILSHSKEDFLILVTVAILFLPVGGFVVKNARYVAPIIPFLVIAGARLCVDAYAMRQEKMWRLAVATVIVVVLASSAFYSFAYANLYSASDSRLQASQWMEQHTLRGGTVLIEQGQFSLEGAIPSPPFRKRLLDMLYLFSRDGYLSCELRIDFLGSLLNEADYIAITAENFSQDFSAVSDLFPLESQFYQKLLSEGLGFRRSLILKNYPSLFGIQINDDDAQSSFTGYDHPKAIVLQKSVERSALEHSLSLWKETARADRGCPDVYINQGVAYLQGGTYLRAIEQFGKILALRPEFTFAYLLLTEAYERAGRTVQADSAYSEWKRAVRTLVARGGRSVGVEIEAAVMGARQIGIEESLMKRFLQDSDELLARSDIRAELLAIQGGIYMSKRMYREAKDYYMKALEFRPDWAVLYLNAAAASFEEGEWSESAYYAEQAIRLDSTGGQVKNLALQLLNRISRAR